MKKKTKPKSDRQLVREAAAKEKRLYRFIRTRMWVSLFISKFFSDGGKIPRDIGNDILVTNNQVFTRNHITQWIVVQEMNEYTPYMWTSDMIEKVKDQVANVVVDTVIKCKRYNVNVNDSGMESRVRSWHSTLEREDSPKFLVRQAARCLSTYELLKSGEQLYRCYVFIAVRSDNSASLKKGMEAVQGYLSAIGATYYPVNMDLDDVVDFTMLMSDKAPAHLADYAPVIFTRKTLAQSLPGIQGMNSTEGVLFGYDKVTNFNYSINFKATANAKNIMIEAGSGFGKTYIAQYWLYPFFADGFNLCIMDIKGTEFEALTRALNGHTISLRNDTNYYINTFAWHEEELLGRSPREYVNHQIRMCKEKMQIIASLTGEEAAQGEAMLEEFLQVFYKMIGATPENTNTWFRTHELNPYVAYEYFEKFLSHEIVRKYGKLALKIRDRLKIFMSRTGSNAHIFAEPLRYIDVLQTRVLRFDFGILEESSDQDPVMFKLHVLDMTIINDAFVSYKKSHKQWTCKVLEESQVVDDYLTRIYTREITLRRAQNQVTILLGNSIAALAQNPLSRPIIENINILVLGTLNKSSRDFLRTEYGISEVDDALLSEVQSASDLDHTFLIVNRMERDATTALISAAVPKEVNNSKLFKVVDVEQK